ncbi:hypothetical protein GQ600_18380 [Phytophthora cactorum]|nr:hypothetical protein GQ600_18380 [Phytophthora cactorum]
MSDSKTEAEQDQYLAAQIAALVSKDRQEKATELTDANKRLVKVLLWAEAREIFSTNKQSMGIEILDDVMSAVIDGKPQEALHALTTRSTSPKSNPIKFFLYLLVDKTPPEVQQDLEKIYRKTFSVKITVYQRVYTWEGHFLWYDPVAYPDFHLTHWRFRHAWRQVFFDWALHAPLFSRSDQSQRRKKKNAAIRARIHLISMGIETWGWYAFLEWIETPGRRDLLWWGGDPGKGSKDAKNFTGTPLTDLTDLRKRDEAAYHRKIKHSLKPYRLDETGFENIPTMLVQLGALNPSLTEFDRRLSDRASPASAGTSPPIVEADHTGESPLNSLGEISIDVDQSIRDDKYAIPTALPLRPSESKLKDFTSLKNVPAPTRALAPDARVEMKKKNHREKPPPPAVKPTSSSQHSSSDESDGDQFASIKNITPGSSKKKKTTAPSKTKKTASPTSKSMKTPPPTLKSK